MADVRIERVDKHFGAVRAVHGLSLEIASGEFLVLLGPSGAGKTTTLRLVAGLERPDAGRVHIGGHDVTDVAPALRDVTFVFQQYSLYPHLSVFDNLAFPLRSPLRRIPEATLREKVQEVARMLRIDDKLANPATKLSGGQMQRVAIGRALVREPALTLMDEPLSSLDAKLRNDLRLELKRIQQDLGATMLYVTHDQTEAMTMGDRVAILRDGVLQQLGTPDEIYDNPVNVFVAGFIGSPSMNLITARMDGTSVVFDHTRVEVPPATMTARPGLAAYSGREVVVGIRPEDFRAEGDATVELKVNRVESLGSELMAYLDGGHEGLEITARLERSARVQEGERARLAVDRERLYFFDPETGEAIG